MLKKPNKSEIFTFLFRWIRKSEICGNPWNKKEYGKGSNLTVHRIQRGVQGGKYVPRNCQIVCKYGFGDNCHMTLHGFEGRRG